MAEFKTVEYQRAKFDNIGNFPLFSSTKIVFNETIKPKIKVQKYLNKENTAENSNLDASKRDKTQFFSIFSRNSRAKVNEHGP